MPYKDKEKARAAKRKYEQEKRETRGETWVIIAYPESAPENWREILEDLHIPIFISPLHDKDVNANGEKKKPHWHIEFMWGTKKSQTQMQEIADKLNSPRPQKQDSTRGCARYLCHLDNPSKAQYKVEDVVCLGGADYLAVISMANDKYEVIHELKRWIKENPDTHHFAFNRVFDWCEENNEKWFRGLCDNCGWIIKEYLQSAYWDMCQEFEMKERLRHLGANQNVCRVCGKVGEDDEFAVIGGETFPNQAICKECFEGGEE